MKKSSKITHKRRVTSRKTKPRKLHHKVISFFKGDGGIYVIFILATVMAGSFALTGGILPTLDPAPSASNEVTIDEDSAKQSSESALQLIDIKVKPPTSTPPPVTQPPVTQPPAACIDKSAVALLIDVSSSMNDSGKATALKNALRSFRTHLSENTVIGMFVFSDERYQDPRQRVSFGQFSNRDNAYTTAINNLQFQGATKMRDAFVDLQSRLDAAQNAFPDYDFKVVFVSDGVPETITCNANDTVDGVCRSDRNYAPSQDPTRSPNIASQIKTELDIPIYTIGIYNDNDEAVNQRLKNLFLNIASNPDSKYYKKANSNGSNLNTIFADVGESLCE